MMKRPPAPVKRRWRAVCTVGALMAASVMLAWTCLDVARRNGFIIQHSGLGLQIDFAVSAAPFAANGTHDEYGFPQVAAICRDLLRSHLQRELRPSHTGKDLKRRLQAHFIPASSTNSTSSSMAALTTSPFEAEAEYWPLMADAFPSVGSSSGDSGSSTSTTTTPASSVSRSVQLCQQLSALPTSLGIYAYPLPWQLFTQWRGAASFNRALLVEEYMIHHLAKGPFLRKVAGQATAFLMPFSAYAYTMAMGSAAGPKRASGRAAFGRLVEHLKTTSPVTWAQHNVCDHVYVSTHDAGTHFATEHQLLVQHAVAMTNTADVEPGSMSPFMVGKDVALVPSISFSLPTYAIRAGAFVSHADEASRPILISFKGSATTHPVRSALFKHFLHPTEEQSSSSSSSSSSSGMSQVGGGGPGRDGRDSGGPIVVEHSDRTRAGVLRYTGLMLTSKYCLHMRGTRGVSPRLVEMVYLGCVPVVVADSYHLPLSDVLDWSAFALRVNQSDVPGRLRDLVVADLPHLQARRIALRRVAPLLLYHAEPQFGDAFYMASLVLQRNLNRNRQRPECRFTD